MNLEKFREKQISTFKRYKEFAVANIDQQIKEIDKAESIQEILEIMIRLPSKEEFEKFMKDGTTRNISTPGKPGEETQH